MKPATPHHHPPISQADRDGMTFVIAILSSVGILWLILLVFMARELIHRAFG